LGKPEVEDKCKPRIKEGGKKIHPTVSRIKQSQREREEPRENLKKSRVGQRKTEKHFSKI